jgi:hypothetical protein
VFIPDEQAVDRFTWYGQAVDWFLQIPMCISLINKWSTGSLRMAKRSTDSTENLVLAFLNLMNLEPTKMHINPIMYAICEFILIYAIM